MRYITQPILKDLEKKMVFIGGPRQCGKTTLAKHILSLNKKGHYFNWDYPLDQKAILNLEWSTEDKLLIFDEIHKFPRWKNWIKGVYDVQKDEHRFLITGSARLDVYRRGGDSLMGRYHYWRLHPFSLDERPAKMTDSEAFDRLMKVGGFPEPFLDGDEETARRWRKERVDKVIKDDLRDLENIKNITYLSLLTDLLKSRVGSPIVISNLAQDLQVSDKTVKHWIELLERMYLIFCVRPYTAKISRAIQKPFKIYFFDNADVNGDDGQKFENLIATHLLKKMHFLEDKTGYRYELKYLRDKDGREIDFVIVKEKSIQSLIEVKLTDKTLSTSLNYYAEKLKPNKAVQIISRKQLPFNKGNAIIADIFHFFNNPKTLETLF